MPEFALPEFTRSLRSLAVPSKPGSDHDQIFAPLIQGRALAHKAQSLEAQLAAFDGARLERSWRAAITTLATARHKHSAPDRRALEAELEILAAPLWERLAAMSTAAERARLAKRDDRRAEFDAWVERVREVFRAADDWWSEAMPVLADSRGRSGSLWRRVVGGRR
jgi:hypothetical protein